MRTVVLAATFVLKRVYDNMSIIMDSQKRTHTPGAVCRQKEFRERFLW